MTSGNRLNSLFDQLKNNPKLPATDLLKRVNNADSQRRQQIGADTENVFVKQVKSKFNRIVQEIRPSNPHEDLSGVDFYIVLFSGHIEFPVQIKHSEKEVEDFKNSKTHLEDFKRRIIVLNSADY